jgi:hypothetical protein
MHDCGGDTATALLGILSTSAVAMFFSCSDATGFSRFRFDSAISVFELPLDFGSSLDE